MISFYADFINKKRDELVLIPGTNQYCLYTFFDGKDTYFLRQVQGLHLKDLALEKMQNNYPYMSRQYYQLQRKRYDYAFKRAIIEDRRVKRWFMNKLEESSYAKGLADGQIQVNTRDAEVQTQLNQIDVKKVVNPLTKSQCQRQHYKIKVKKLIVRYGADQNTKNNPHFQHRIKNPTDYLTENRNQAKTTFKFANDS